MSKNNFQAKLAALKNRKIRHYCHFNKKTGEILAVTNNTKLSDSYFEIEKELAEEFKNGIRLTDRNYVKFNTSTKKHEILKKEDYRSKSVKDILHELILSNDAEVFVTKDYKNKKWTVSVDENLNMLYNGGVVIDSDFLHFSVTAKKDPHYLYRTLIVNLKSLLENTSIDIDFDDYDESYQHYSVYTAKKLDSYAIREIK